MGTIMVRNNLSVHFSIVKMEAADVCMNATQWGLALQNCRTGFQDMRFRAFGITRGLGLLC